VAKIDRKVLKNLGFEKRRLDDLKEEAEPVRE